MRFINPIELARILKDDDIFVLDVRETYELEICKITSNCIPMGQIADRIGEIPKDKHVILTCKTGRRASAVANMLLSEFDFSNVSVLEGGIIAWIEKVDDQLESY